MPQSNHSCIIFATETTGTDTDRDQIIEFSVQQSLTDSSPPKTWRSKPGIPIVLIPEITHAITSH